MAVTNGKYFYEVLGILTISALNCSQSKVAAPAGSLFNIYEYFACQN